MGHHLFTIAMLLIQAIGNAQTNTAVITADGKPVGIVDNIYGAVIPVIRPANVDGSPFMCDEWNKGSVFFKKGKRADSLPIKFDLQNNLLYFQQDSLTMTFLEEISSFRFICTTEPGKLVYFKNNYPVLGQLSPLIFYQVLIEGSSFHLLKFLNKKIVEEYAYNSPPKRKFQLMTEWYVYDVKADQMLKVKNGKSALMKKMPSAASKIEELCKKHNLQLKSEEELTKLFSLLNDQ